MIDGAGQAPPPIPSGSPPTSIAERQNTPALLALLRADAWHYGRAKRWHLVRIAGTLTFAAAAPIITFWAHEAADGVAAAAGAWVLAGRTVLRLAEDRELKLGATIQEQFDTELFRLDWNTSLVGQRAAPEEIASAAAQVETDDHLRDWYADTGAAPWPLDVVLCQRASAVWGRRAHFAYGMTILGIGIGWLVAGLIMGVAANVSLGGYLVMLFLPSQPAFLDTIDLYQSHRRQSLDKGRVEQAADALWVLGVQDSAAVTASDCRQLQDRTYGLRRHGPQIPQWFYRLRRGSDERAMRAAAAHLLAQLPAQ